jgi:hypothetical protein
MTPGFVSEWTNEPGTFEDLLADARTLGFPATKRLVHDWIALGLLDHPKRRSKGRAGGSDKALFPASQRNLFRLLVQKRPEVKTIAGMCGVPVAVWLWWGDEYAPTSQVQRALSTWAGQVSKVSWQTVRRHARQATDFIDDLGASRDERQHLIDLLARIAYSGKLPDEGELARAVTEVFDPARSGRAFGSRLATATAGFLVTLIAGRLRGMERIRQRASFEELERARAIYRDTRMQWAKERADLAQDLLRPKDATLFKPETLQDLFDGACSELMLIIGLLARAPSNTTSSGQQTSAPGAAQTARGLTTGGIGPHGEQAT